jgi:hypothetical protein
MRADNSRYLQGAAAARRDATLERARTAIDDLRANGRPVTIATVSQAGRVSRSWLYAETAIRAEIAAADAAPHTPKVPVVTAASDASLRRRLELAHGRIGELTDEVHRLRTELATTHGLLRAQRVHR